MLGGIAGPLRAGPRTKGNTMTRTYKRIAVEEAYNIPEVGLRARPAGSGNASTNAAFAELSRQLLDLGDGRIAEMDRDGVDVQLLVMNAPGTQHLEPPRSVDMAMLSNDRLAEACRKYPGRLYGLAAMPTPDPQAAAKELQRGINTLGLKGALINSHTNGEYLDNKKYWPILEAAQSLNVPIYLHPREPSPPVAQILDFPQFLAGWSYAVEVGTHVLRMMAGGVFDEFPKLRMVIGHMGEAIPFYLQRMDNRYLAGAKLRDTHMLKRLPSEYFLDHFHITTSGMNYGPQLQMAIQMMGIDKVLWAADYPFENQADAVNEMEAMTYAEADKKKLFQTNAERVFAL